MGDILIKILVCFIAGAGAGIGTGFAGMSAAAVIGPMLITFLGVPAYDAVGIGLISDVTTVGIKKFSRKHCKDRYSKLNNYRKGAYNDRYDLQPPCGGYSRR